VVDWLNEVARVTSARPAIEALGEGDIRRVVWGDVVAEFLTWDCKLANASGV
jgi:hypothetical protein